MQREGWWEHIHGGSVTPVWAGICSQRLREAFALLTELAVRASGGTAHGDKAVLISCFRRLSCLLGKTDALSVVMQNAQAYCSV